MVLELLLGPTNEGRTGLMQSEQAPRIRVGVIHEVDGVRLGNQQVEQIHAMELSVRDLDEGRDGTAQVQHIGEFHVCLRGPELGLGKDGQVQINGGGIECVHGFVQVQAEILVPIQSTRSGDQPPSRICTHAPRAIPVGARHGLAMDARGGAGTIQIGRDGPQGGGQRSQSLALSELSKGHGAERLGTAYEEIAMVAGLDVRVRLPPHELHHLGEQGLTSIHLQSTHQA